MLDFPTMPPTGKIEPPPTLDVVAGELGVYPIAAYEFVQQGLAYTVSQVYGPLSKGAVRHITGQQLCEGLRQLASRRWGYLARAVLGHWNITSTMDFGRIVFSLARHGVMATTPQDRLEDFRTVYDFARAFESAYKFPTKW
jgi:uncharacterized repeat protein (TIGR04138 family)